MKENQGMLEKVEQVGRVSGRKGNGLSRWEGESNQDVEAAEHRAWWGPLFQMAAQEWLCGGY